jgi:hypothetical protein
MILVLLLGAGTAGFRDFQRRQTLDAAVRQVVADMRLAQEYAISGRKEDWTHPTTNEKLCVTLLGYKVQFDKSGGSYVLSAYCRGSSGNRYTCKANGSTNHNLMCIGDEKFLPDPIDISYTGGNIKDITFNALGTPNVSTPGNITIQLGSFSKTITVSKTNTITVN